MRRGPAIALVAAVLGGLLWRAPAAWACSCDALATRAHVRDADAVFVGVATRVETVERSVPYADRSATATFEVDAVYKGVVPPIVVVRTSGIGDACGVEFVERERYAVFATAMDAALHADICNGTTDDEGVLRRAALRPATVYDAEDHAALLAPEPHDAGRAGAIATGAILLSVALAATLVAWRARRARPHASEPLR